MEHLVTGRAFTLAPTMTFGQMMDALATTPGMPHVISVTGSELPDPTMCGAYMEPLQTILINSSMLYVQQRCTLIHELFHWVHADNTCEPTMQGKNEHTVRRETALFLINPRDYYEAEQEYGADTYNIACELDVTVSVLDDYRQAISLPGYPVRRRAHMPTGSRRDRIRALQRYADNYQQTH